MAGSRGRRLATAFSFVLLLGLAAGSRAAAYAPPVTTPVTTQVNRFLLRLDQGNSLAAYAVADAWMQKSGERTVAWRMSVTYYLPAKRKGKPDQMITRQYGGSVMNQVDGRNLQLDLTPGAIVLDLPTPGGDHLITVSGGKDAKGSWALKGQASFPAPKGKKKQVWSVKSTPKFKHGKEILREVP